MKTKDKKAKALVSNISAPCVKQEKYMKKYSDKYPVTARVFIQVEIRGGVATGTHSRTGHLPKEVLAKFLQEYIKQIKNY